MAALLVWGHKNISSTDIECSWKKKGTTEEEIKSIDDLYPDNSVVFNNTTCDLKALFLKNIKETKQVVGFTWLLSPEPPKTESEILLLENVIFSNEFRLEENKIDFLNKLFKIDLNQIKQIANKTIGQSENIKWSLYRQYRLTASNFHKILMCMRKNKPIFPISLYKTLLGQYRIDSMKSIQWGRTHEITAIEEFQKKYKITVQSTGIWLHESGLLGASPDGLSDVQGNKVCIEVKCPYKYRNSNLKECLTDCKDYIIYFDTNLNDFNLNDKHPYYDQIQGEIYLTKSTSAILIIWTPNMMIVVQIEKDPEWSSNIDLLLKFYYNNYIPWLLEQKS